ncbi:MAG: helix-turn-helix domain-containing protein [Planctomycetota bacterium]
MVAKARARDKGDADAHTGQEQEQDNGHTRSGPDADERAREAREVWARIWQVARSSGIDSYADLAERVDLTPSYLSLVARGKRSLSSKALLNVAQALGVDPEWLQYGEGKEPELHNGRDEERCVTLSLDLTADEATQVIDLLKNLRCGG